MAVYSIIPNTNVSFNDIRDTLNANGGSVTNDFITAFQERAKINKWSKRKPVILLKDFCQDFDSKVMNYTPNWWKAWDGNCGFEVTESGNLATTLKADWIYVKPGNGSLQPLRISDFLGYYHGAQPPLAHYMKNGIILDKAQQNSLTLAVTGNVESNVELTINDINGVVGKYLSAYITGLNTNFKISASKAIQAKYDPESLSITIAGSSFSALGNYTCDLFFSSAKFAPGTEPVSTFLPFFKTSESPSSFTITVIRQAPIKITTISLSYGVYGDFKTWSEANPDFSDDPIWIMYCNGTVVFKFEVENTTSGTILVNSDQLRLHSDTFWNTREVTYGDMYNSSGTQIKSISIPPKTTINIMMEYNGALIKKDGEPTIPYPGSPEATMAYFMNSSVMYYADSGGAGTGTGGSGVFAARYADFSQWKFEVVEWG